MTSIITPEAKPRCDLEAKRIQNLRILRDLQIAMAFKTIHAHYDALERGDEPPQLGRRIFDRRTDTSWTGRAARPAPQPLSDMADMDLHLSVES